MHKKSQNNLLQEQWHCQWQLPDIVTYTKVCEEGTLANTGVQWCVQEEPEGRQQCDGHQQYFHSYQQRYEDYEQDHPVHCGWAGVHGGAAATEGADGAG